MKQRPTDYFAQLTRQSELASAALQALGRVLGQYDLFALHAALERLQPTLQESAALRHALTGAVLEDFLPPLERGDVMGIATALDSIVRCAARALRRIFALQLTRIPPPAHTTAEPLAEQAECIVQLIALLPQKEFGRHAASDPANRHTGRCVRRHPHRSAASVSSTRSQQPLEPGAPPTGAMRRRLHALGGDGGTGGRAEPVIVFSDKIAAKVSV
ncbi:MAG: hypothetical protein LBS96_02605 [Oscillospiraceae bacterium]|nr:hypothetical protein [Oscillospiraceae bacterium]